MKNETRIHCCDSFNQMIDEVIEIVESQFNKDSFSREMNVGEV